MLCNGSGSSIASAKGKPRLYSDRPRSLLGSELLDYARDLQHTEIVETATRDLHANGQIR